MRENVNELNAKLETLNNFIAKNGIIKVMNNKTNIDAENVRTETLISMDRKRNLFFRMKKKLSNVETESTAVSAASGKQCWNRTIV